MRSVVVHVDRLVLKGIPPEHRGAFGEILRQELGRHLASPKTAGLLANRGNQARLSPGPVSIPAGGSESDTARIAAQAIARELAP